MIILQPVCFSCKHFDLETSTCPAFPGEDIPDEILSGENDHKKPLEGQKNNIVFEPGKPGSKTKP
jgi:hypothetical protein